MHSAHGGALAVLAADPDRLPGLQDDQEDFPVLLPHARSAVHDQLEPGRTRTGSPPWLFPGPPRHVRRAFQWVPCGLVPRLARSFAVTSHGATRDGSRSPGSTRKDVGPQAWRRTRQPARVLLRSGRWRSWRSTAPFPNTNSRGAECRSDEIDPEGRRARAAACCRSARLGPRPYVRKLQVLRRQCLRTFDLRGRLPAAEMDTPKLLSRNRSTRRQCSGTVRQVSPASTNIPMERRSLAKKCTGRIDAFVASTASREPNDRSTKPPCGHALTATNLTMVTGTTYARRMAWIMGFIGTWYNLLFTAAQTGILAVGVALELLVVMGWVDMDRHLRGFTRQRRIGALVAILAMSIAVTVYEEIASVAASAEERTQSAEAEADRRIRDAERRVAELEERLEASRQEQLSIIVFNATSRRTPWLFGDAVNQLKRVLNDCSIDDRYFWENEFMRQRTTVYYQGARARDAAISVDALLPGHQEVRPLEESTLFGIHPDRDIVLMLGQDASIIADRLAADENTYPCPPLGAPGL